MNGENVPKKKGMSGGCKVALIILAILVLLVIVAIVLSYAFCGNIKSALIEKGVTAVEQKVLDDLPEGFDKDDVSATFDQFKEKLKNTDFGDDKVGRRIQQLSNELTAAMSDDEIDTEELEKLLELMKGFPD